MKAIFIILLLSMFSFAENNDSIQNTILVPYEMKIQNPNRIEKTNDNLDTYFSVVGFIKIAGGGICQVMYFGLPWGLPVIVPISGAVSILVGIWEINLIEPKNKTIRISAPNDSIHFSEWPGDVPEYILKKGNACYSNHLKVWILCNDHQKLPNNLK